MRGSLTVDEEIFQDTLDRGDVVSIGPRSREIKGNGGMRRPWWNKGRKKTKGDITTIKIVCAAIRREIQTAKHPFLSLSFSIYISLSKASSTFLFERGFEFRAVIEQRLNRFNRFSNHRRFFGERTRRLRIIDGIFDRVESILVERENFSFLFFFLPFIFFINDSTQIKILPFKIHPRSHSFRERRPIGSRVEVNSQISMGGLWLVYNGSDDWRRGSDLKPIGEGIVYTNKFILRVFKL